MQEVVVIDIPSVFEMCLSRDLTTKLGGYLALDWSHLILRTKHRLKMKILSKSFHLEHIVNDTNLCFKADHTSTFQQERYCVEIPIEEDTIDGFQKKKCCSTSSLILIHLTTSMV